MIAFFHTTLYQPLYNGLIFLIGVLPGGDVGLAVLILTILVKLLLLPLSEKAVATQLAMKRYEPELNNIKLKLKDREEQAQAVLKFYKEHKINPVASFLVVLIQMPIIISLYYVFYKGGLPGIDPLLVYPFIKAPVAVNMHFLGIIDMGVRSIPLAIAVGLTQFIQMRFSVPPLPPREKKAGAPPSLKDEMARSLNVQMRYIMPALLAFIALNVSGAVSLYWTASNLFAIAQELYLRKKFGAARAVIAGGVNSPVAPNK